MRDWPDLQRELDEWHRTGQSVTLWWRDDDAHQPTPQLERLLGMAARTNTPVALCVPPAPAARALVAEVDGVEPLCTVLQHGYAHINHSPAGQKKCELGIQRALDVTLGELSSGRAKLAQLFEQNYAAVMVPPWNRIDQTVVSRLKDINFVGLSRFAARKKFNIEGLIECNTHVDIIDWRNTRRFTGVEQALDQLITHLEQRRAGEVDVSEPTGLLTHHLQHDAGCWQFIAELLDLIGTHPAATWLNAKTIFGDPGYGVI